MTELTIRTPEDWWNLLDKNINNIKRMMSYTYQNLKVRATELDDLIKEKEVVKLVKLFNDIWYYMPERICREQLGWLSLCDLCSECWVHPEFDPDCSIGETE